CDWSSDVCSSDLERARNLRRDAEQFIEFEPPPLTHAQRLALDELGRDEMGRICFVDLVDGENIWMVEGRCRLGFLHEPIHAAAIRGNVTGQNLQRDFASELGVLSKINFTHATRADL